MKKTLQHFGNNPQPLFYGLDDAVQRRKLLGGVVNDSYRPSASPSTILN
jgi:hypothetical protein